MPKGKRDTSGPYLRGGVWYIRYWVPDEGVERRESSKSTDVNVARALLNKRRNEADQQEITPANVTVGKLLDLYLDEQREKKNFQVAESRVRLHLKPAFGRLKVPDLTTQKINAFVAEKKKAKYAAASINRCLEILKRALRLGVDNRPPLVVNPIKIRLLDEEDNVREGFLDHHQYVALREELPAHLRLVLVLAYHWGMRRGEILNLRWDQVDWEAKNVRLEKQQTKAKKGRLAPIFGELAAWLEMAYASPDRAETIVSFRGQPMTEVGEAWKNACKRAKGVPDNLLLHDLRRTAVRNMVRADIPEKQAMVISGHKTRSIFDRYDIVDERDIENSGKKLEIYLANQALVRPKGRPIEKTEGLQARPNTPVN